ncbi:hypothetical protein AMAG_00944 [Allomyces macrogynus ATCC 38327]|uniref:Uncharacterized protein n=1 Tax=Allomyces macrogynus (strain ATCC 38327) TaxID=578462 RepID=A0A0L0RXA6_ALLM3|nr:hypothetical protein AMAG_00944 [Allomyces macrogynus ATCC 38327]|eukprot:KNE55007.1 hypothetical protein AMAG_00944 [Allomyces macrogynus ATCC 38327]
MKLQALFVLAAAAAFVAADPMPDYSSTEDALIENVGAATMNAPASHLTVAAALKKPNKTNKRRRRQQPAIKLRRATPEEKVKQAAWMRARRAEQAKNRKNTLFKPIIPANVQRPRVHGKPGGLTRWPKGGKGMRKPTGTGKSTVPLATRLQNKIDSLPVGSRRRMMLERRLARLNKPKTAALMSMSEAPSAFSAASSLRPFVDPPFANTVDKNKDGSIKLMRHDIAPGRGVVHRYGFQTAKPLGVPAGTKYVTILGKANVWFNPTSPGMCEKGNTELTVFHGGRPLGGLKFPRGYYGNPRRWDPIEVTVPVYKLSPTPAPITVQAAHDHTNPYKCQERSSLSIRDLKVQFHDSVPSGGQFSVSDSGYDYSDSYDDSWDDAYYGGDFSASDEAGSADDDNGTEDAYYGGDFSVSEDAYGDDMWEDSYDGDFAVADEAGSADVDDGTEDAYYGGDFSLSEDAYGDDMWEDSYDGEGYSVEDAYTEDAADDYY